MGICYILALRGDTIYTDLVCCSLDQEQKEELVHVIDKLLSDKTTLVVGSAVMAFEEVGDYNMKLSAKEPR